MAGLCYNALRQGMFLVVICILLASCSEPIGGDGKSPVFLTVTVSQPWGIFSDVYTPGVPGNVALDAKFVDIYSNYKNPSGATATPLADVLLQEMRVSYFRHDGNPSVPEPFIYFLGNSTVPAGASLNLEIPIVLAKAKLESPLKELAFGGGEGEIIMGALVQFYGEDLMGNAVSTEIVLTVHAADY